MRVSSTDFNNKICEMHTCLRYTMRMCKWMGVFPVEGLDKPTSLQLRLSKRTISNVYYIATVIGQILLAAFSLYRFLSKEICLANITNFVFNISGLSATIILMRLAQYWPKLISKAFEIENDISEIRVSKETAKKSTIVACTVMILALVETTLCIIFNMKLVTTCMTNGSSLDVFERYVQIRLPYVYEYTSFTVWKAVAVEIINLQTTFLWNITDVITMCFSIYLISYFNDFNKKIFASCGKDCIDWGYLRKQYSNLVSLVKLVDDHINCFICLSFFSNLFFICIQLYNTLSDGYSGHHYECNANSLEAALTSPQHFIYYTYSFLFLLGRAFIMYLLAANVHFAAQQPMLPLFNVPTSSYDLEVQRFRRQISYAPAALSGIFFNVTRLMILKVFSSIVTYELVLLQIGQGYH